MKRRYYLSFLALALTAATSVAFVIGHNTSAGAGLASSAAAALPASDFVIVVDVHRALNEAVPTMLSSNPALLAKFNSHLQEFEAKTGINPRVFESVAIGGSLRPNAPAGRRDPSGVLIASGTFKSDQLIEAGFAAAQKECQIEKSEQQYEGKTIFVISSVKPLKKLSPEVKTSTSLPYDRFGDPRSSATLVAKAPDAPKVPASETESRSGRVVVFSTSQIASTEHRLGVSPAVKDNFAISAIAPNMIAVGSLESVRAAIDASLGRNRVDDELVQLALQNPNAIVGFGGRVPQSATDKAGSENAGNPFASYFASVREFYGAFGLNGSETESFVAVRTEKPEQAQDISQAINSFKGLVSFGVLQSSGQDSDARNAIASVLKGLTINANGNELRIDLKIPHSTLAPLIRMHR